jgi:hypothetical protein
VHKSKAIRPAEVGIVGRPRLRTTSRDESRLSTILRCSQCDESVSPPGTHGCAKEIALNSDHSQSR